MAPSNWTALDENFPTFTPGMPAEAQIAQMQNYLFVMKEQLRYSLSNLSTDNWNATALKKLSEDTVSGVEKTLKKTIEQLGLMEQGLDSLGRELAEERKKTDGLHTSIGELRDRVEQDGKTMEKVAEQLRQAVEKIDMVAGILRRDGAAAVLGNAGERLDILGDVYINGEPYAKEGTV